MRDSRLLTLPGRLFDVDANAHLGEHCIDSHALDVPGQLRDRHAAGQRGKLLSMTKTFCMPLG